MAQAEKVGPRRLLLVRHGLPDYRQGQRADEPPGPPLSEIGRMQVCQAIALLCRTHPTAIHASPLARTLQSAEIIAGPLGLKVRVDPDLREWHRTERLYQVSVRSARWLANWLRTDERTAVVVGHASPLMAILRSALYLPHFPWWSNSQHGLVRLATHDRFEVTMACVFELIVSEHLVTARCLHHPDPRIAQVHRRRILRRFPRPVGGDESTQVMRPNFSSLVGCP